MNYLLYLRFKLPRGDIAEYDRMRAISRRSFERHLGGTWDVLTLHGDLEDASSHLGAVNQMYAALFDYMYELYGDGHSVLMCDPDVVAVKPLEVFGRFKGMMLFAPTDPPRGYGFDPYLNAGIVYLPSTAERRLWSFLDGAPMKDYDDSQKVFNAMFYAQIPVPRLHPELNWSPWVPSSIPKEEAQIIHCHSTRGTAEAIRLMEELTCTSGS